MTVYSNCTLNVDHALFCKCSTTEDGAPSFPHDLCPEIIEHLATLETVLLLMAQPSKIGEGMLKGTQLSE